MLVLWCSNGRLAGGANPSIETELFAGLDVLWKQGKVDWIWSVVFDGKIAETSAAYLSGDGIGSGGSAGDPMQCRRRAESLTVLMPLTKDASAS